MKTAEQEQKATRDAVARDQAVRGRAYEIMTETREKFYADPKPTKPLPSFADCMARAERELSKTEEGNEESKKAGKEPAPATAPTTHAATTK